MITRRGMDIGFSQKGETRLSTDGLQRNGYGALLCIEKTYIN